MAEKDKMDGERVTMTAIAKISPKGQITVPVGIRRALGVEEGDNVVFELFADGAVEVKGLPTPESILSVVGILQSPNSLPDIDGLRTNAADELRSRFAEKGPSADAESRKSDA